MITLLTGPGGCVGSPCTRLRGATALVRIAVSPDGRNLYLSGQAGGLSILARDGRTGRIHQLAGRGGCFRRDGRQGCGLLRTLIDPAGLTVSPDGRDVYVTTTHGVLGFARNRQTGALRPLTGAGRCVDATLLGCRPLRGLRAPTELTASGDGTLYVAGSVSHLRAPATGALAVLSRCPATGALSSTRALRTALTMSQRPGARPRRALTRSRGSCHIREQPGHRRPDLHRLCHHGQRDLFRSAPTQRNRRVRRHDVRQPRQWPSRGDDRPVRARPAVDC